MSKIEQDESNVAPDHSEALSALVDGEVNELDLRRLLKTLSDDESTEMNEAWQGYQLIGSAMRREPTAGIDISKSVSAVIANENAAASGFSMAKPLKQMAVAASFAVVAFVGVQQFQASNTGDSLNSSQVADSSQEDVFRPAADLEQLPPPGFDLGARGESSPVSVGGAQTQNQKPNISYGNVPFDEAAFHEHVETSLQKHSENTAETNQNIYPMLRAPIDGAQE